jgi:O-antigen chain-terminating methyltransferase
VPDPTPDLEQLIETLRDRVEQRRRDGAYAPGVEEELDRHFTSIVNLRQMSPTLAVDELEHAINDFQHQVIGRERISNASNLPGGPALHRLIGKIVARQIEGVLAQTREQQMRLGHILALSARVSEIVADGYDKRVLQPIADLQARLAEEQRALNAAVEKVDEVAARVPGVAVDTWYTADAFTAAFRGGVDDMESRYDELARLFVGCSPVLDIGFGRGEFLRLLRDLEVDAYGIETDPTLVEAARNQGLRAEVGRAVEHLSMVPDDHLGGVVMIQVIEHLTPQHVIDVVQIMADKIRPGGRAVVETVNPMSLFTYAHALWVDPDHVRPVHPNYLRFLFAEAGFATVEKVDRSPVPADESLELLPGDDELAKRLNVNFERINALLFGPQDYAIVATR